MAKVTVIDALMGTGKTEYVIKELIPHEKNNILYIAPKLENGHDLFHRNGSNKDAFRRKLYEVENRGDGKLTSISSLISEGRDIISTHELFRRFDEKCKDALCENKYTLVIDEVMTAVNPFHFEHKDDLKKLRENGDITVDEDGVIWWTGQRLDTRYNDIMNLCLNKSLISVDQSNLIWVYPPDVFDLFDKVYVLTYLFTGSLLAYYFQLTNISYEIKSLKREHDALIKCDPYAVDKSNLRKRIQLYDGEMNINIGIKPNTLSRSWMLGTNPSSKTPNPYYQKEIDQLRRNFANYIKNVCQAKSGDVLWTTFKNAKSFLQGKGYQRSFISCNAKSTNDFSDRTVLIYGLNWFVHPAITNFFNQRGIKIDADQIALSEMLQWVWRSNIRESDSDLPIKIYVPSVRMRELFNQWLMV